MRPGILEAHEITAKHIPPSELERCMATGKRALKRAGGAIFRDPTDCPKLLNFAFCSSPKEA